jgi:hypothetical protein
MPTAARTARPTSYRRLIFRRGAAAAAAAAEKPPPNAHTRTAALGWRPPTRLTFDAAVGLRGGWVVRKERLNARAAAHELALSS